VTREPGLLQGDTVVALHSALWSAKWPGKKLCFLAAPSLKYACLWFSLPLFVFSSRAEAPAEVIKHVDSFEAGAACPDDEDEAAQGFSWHKSGYSVSLSVVLVDPQALPATCHA